MELFWGLMIVCCYVILGVVTTRWAGRRFGKTPSEPSGLAHILGILVFALGIPLGDHTIGYLYYLYSCEQSGRKIYRPVRNVEGFMSHVASADMASQLGYSYLEQGSDVSSVTRYDVRDVSTVVHKNVPSISQYVLRRQFTNKLYSMLEEHQYVIEDRSNGERLATRTSIRYRGGWLVRALLAGFGGTAAHCPEAPFDFVHFVLQVLQPIRPTLTAHVRLSSVIVIATGVELLRVRVGAHEVGLEPLSSLIDQRPEPIVLRARIDRLPYCAVPCPGKPEIFILLDPAPARATESMALLNRTNVFVLQDRLPSDIGLAARFRDKWVARPLHSHGYFVPLEAAPEVGKLIREYKTRAVKTS